MGWVMKGQNGPYYYHSRRDGARVVSEYAGAGDVAHVLEAFEARDRALWAFRRDLERAEREEQHALDTAIDQAGAVVRAVMQEALTANGYHQHKREWRRKRRT